MPDPEGWGSFTPSPGMGGLSISFGGNSNARTVVPDDTYGVMTLYKAFRLDFTPTSGGDGNRTIYMDVHDEYNGTNAYLQLPGGTYSLAVTAFLTARPDTTNPTGTGNLPSNPALHGSATGIIVSSTNTTPTPVTVTLTPSMTSGQSGKLITKFSSIITGATVEMEKRTTLAGTPTPITIDDTTWDVDEDLDAGQYYVIFSITKASITKRIMDVVHIYDNMTSTWEYNFVNLATAFPTAPPPGNGAIIIVPDLEAGTPLQLNAIGYSTLSMDIDNGGASAGTLVLTLTNYDDYDSVVLFVNGDLLNPITVFASSGTYTITVGTTVPFTTADYYQVLVSGMVGSEINSATFEFTITEN